MQPPHWAELPAASDDTMSVTLARLGWRTGFLVLSGLSLDSVVARAASQNP